MSAQVTLIDSDEISLKNVSSEEINQLSKLGYQGEDRGNYYVIKNKGMEKTINDLILLDFIFADDFKDMACPASLLSLMEKKGWLRDNYKIFYYRDGKLTVEEMKVVNRKA